MNRYRIPSEEKVREVIREHNTMSQTKSTTRELPEEQQKSEWDGDESQLPAVMEEAIEMEEEMIDIASRTNADGTVVGHVKAVHFTKKNGTIAVDVDLPAEYDLERFHFDKPKSWTYDWEWVRFIESYTGGAERTASIVDPDEDENVPGIADENYGGGIDVLVKRTEDDYEIVIPGNSRFALHDIKKRLSNPSRQGHQIWKILPPISAYLLVGYVITPPSWSVSIALWVAFTVILFLAEAVMGNIILGWSDS